MKTFVFIEKAIPLYCLVFYLHDFKMNMKYLDLNSLNTQEYFLVTACNGTHHAWNIKKLMWMVKKLAVYTSTQVLSFINFANSLFEWYLNQNFRTAMILFRGFACISSFTGKVLLCSFHVVLFLEAGSLFRILTTVKKMDPSIFRAESIPAYVQE